LLIQLLSLDATTSTPITSPSPSHYPVLSLFFFTAPSPPQIYPLSLHDALPISLPGHGKLRSSSSAAGAILTLLWFCSRKKNHNRDRKSTRLNSSHVSISYAVFCLKKKKKKK